MNADNKSELVTPFLSSSSSSSFVSFVSKCYAPLRERGLKKDIGGKTMNYRYTIVIQWSDEDQCYIVSLPEWSDYCHTHGDSYEEALKNAQEVLELLVDTYTEDGKPLPEPIQFGKPLQLV